MENREKIKKVYNQVCRRCNEMYPTYAKYGSICPTCSRQSKKISARFEIEK